MKQTIKSIILKANQDGCTNGNYVNHIASPELFLFNVKLDTGATVLVPVELVLDFIRNPNISVCGRIRVK